jgi:carnitine 3-dehydrogenase
VDDARRYEWGVAGQPINRVTVVGTGVIGSSWAACFLARGLDVIASDPAPGAEERVRAAVASHWPALERIGLAAGASVERLAFAASPEDAVAAADFVQESGPERADIKQQLFAQLDSAAPRSTVLASSSSGLAPTAIQARCTHPERVLVGHPFNPPHLVPLIEVVGGERTDPVAIDQAMAFYSALGKHPIRLEHEIPGHVANRLQAALWREAFHLLERGVASVADIDAAIAYGPGLRWGLLGPFLNLHLSGGDGGLRHVLEHLGPPIERWWDDLGDPRLTSGLCGTAIEGVEQELDGLDLTDLVARRDELLIDLLRARGAAKELP